MILLAMWRQFIEHGGWWVIAQSGLMVLVIVTGPLFPGTEVTIAGMAAGGILAGLAALVGIGGVAVLKGNRTIFPRPNPGSHLVQKGVYCWMRHPLYTSLMLLAAAWSLFWSSWTAFAASVILAVFLNSKATREEGWLRARFPDYDAYSRRVKRFIPGVL
jgi:protein-S-isoprenylcysteine O-methyltransferase Ste14